MKKTSIIFLMFLYLSLGIFSQENKNQSEFNLIADFYAFPFLYESTNNMYGISLNGSIFMGAKINKFIIGAEIFEHYVSLTAQNNDLNYVGAWNIIRGIISFYYSPAKWIQLKTGLGGAWYKSAFSNNQSGIISKNEAGLSFIFDTAFKPPFEYIELKLLNKLDLFFATNTVTPYYYGGINCIFHPYFNWISLYIETGVMTFFYKGPPENINSAIFTWGFGITFNLPFPSIINYTKEKVKKKQQIIIKEVDETTDEIKMEELKRNEKGKIIKFNNIMFYPDSEKIKEKSYSILDKIASILLEITDIKIEIRGHANDTKKPKDEMELSIKRAENVKNYLVNKGIDPNRMLCSGFGSYFTKNSTIEEVNRKVEFKILDIKE